MSQQFLIWVPVESRGNEAWEFGCVWRDPVEKGRAGRPVRASFRFSPHFLLRPHSTPLPSLPNTRFVIPAARRREQRAHLFNVVLYHLTPPLKHVVLT
ncbi:hypothetical protein ARMGADRAFT_1009604 [Armillaria gallica]|uniref:Uncharacterized protein n=1 Tax=Armillaria gallica TaxID=47427 RepID=A0A2H3EAM5_ARMGA|nr:hypothetical protein ARMGADRAFT_1009604 [Armillaria gallica]